MTPKFISLPIVSETFDSVDLGNGMCQRRYKSIERIYDALFNIAEIAVIVPCIGENVTYSRIYTTRSGEQFWPCAWSIDVVHSKMRMALRES